MSSGGCPNPTDPARAEIADAAGMVRARADAMLPADLLQSDEVIILLIKPSPLFIVLDSLRALVGIVVILAVALMLVRVFDPRVSTRDLILAAVGVAGLRLFWQFLEWLSHVYVLTDRRVVRVMGVLRVQVFECQLKKIQHTHTLFSIRERLFGLGTIGFATAGSVDVEAYWRMVARPLEVNQIIVKAIGRYR